MPALVNLDSAMSEIVEKFDRKVEEIIKELEADDDEKMKVKERFAQAFRDNMRLGMATVFGDYVKENVASKKDNENNVTPPKNVTAPPTDVTVEDMMSRDDAVLNLAGRRKRYPEQTSNFLSKALKKERTMLKDLKVNLPNQVVDPKLDTVDVEQKDTEKLLVKVVSDLATCKELVVSNRKDANKLEVASKILERVGDACLAQEGD
jgi:hypothetical protein